MVTARELPQVVGGRKRLPEIAEPYPDEVTTYDSLAQDASALHLRLHLIAQDADPERLLVTADRWIVQDAEDFVRRRCCPDLPAAIDVALEAHKGSRCCIIAEPSKPPDFVLAVASLSTGRVDVGPKRDDYECFRIREYWRFDESGAVHGARLAGERLAVSSDGSTRRQVRTLPRSSKNARVPLTSPPTPRERMNGYPRTASKTTEVTGADARNRDPAVWRETVG